MKIREPYSSVLIYYRGITADGNVFDERVEGSPFEAVLGNHSLPLGVEDALFEMQEGEERTLELCAKDAFGEYDEAGLITVPTYEVAGAERMPVGQYIKWAYKKADRPVLAKVVDVNEARILLDMNHPLAGQEVTYWIKLVKEGEKKCPPPEIAWLFEDRKKDK